MLTATQSAGLDAGLCWAKSSDPSQLRALFDNHQHIADTLAGEGANRLDVAKWLASLTGGPVDDDSLAAFWEAAAGDGWRELTRDLSWVAAWSAGVITVGAIAVWNERRTASQG